MNLETIRRLKLKEPYECNHFSRIFISSTRASGDGGSYRETIFVCAQCGMFFIFANKDGVQFDITFTLPTDELVEAAGKYDKFLTQSEKEQINP